jgi:hypothetical protein
MNKLTNLDDTYNFIVTNYEDYTLPLYEKDKKNIVLYLSDEYGIYRNWFNKVDLVFRTYPRGNNFDNKKIFPIPCGLVMPDYVTYKMEEPKKKLSDRKYDFFYSGQESPKRYEFLKRVTESTKDFNGILRNTQNFRTGYTIDEYFQIMNETKISFVPLGKVIPESFRYMESFESGCLVITDFPIDEYKDIWYYKESPAIFIKNYDEINDYLIDNAISNIDVLAEDNLKYYNDFLSTTAVAKYIECIIKEKQI